MKRTDASTTCHEASSATLVIASIRHPVAGLRRLWVLGLLLSQVLATTTLFADAATTTLIYPPWKHAFGLHRIGQSHLTLRAGFRHKFNNPQGIAALKLAAEDDSTTTKDDDELTVFGVNSGEHVIIYNTSLTTIAFYGKRGTGVGEFESPQGIAANREGWVVVADTGNDRLHVLRYHDNKLHHVRFVDGEFDGIPLRQPLGVSLEANEIYVVDPSHHRILVLTLKGELNRVLAPRQNGKPLLDQPFDVAAIRSSEPYNYFRENFIVVTDSSNQRLHQLRPNGTLIRSLSTQDCGPQVHFFDHVAIDFHGNVYVSDRNGRLHKFTRKLQYLLSIGKQGRGNYEFDEPRGIAIHRRFGQIFVAERKGASYLWTGTDVFSPTLLNVKPLSGTRWSARVRYFLTEYARVQLDLVDDGSTEVSLQRAQWSAPGMIVKNFEFEIPEAQEHLRLRVRAFPLYSSRKFLTVEKHTIPQRFRIQD